ncbi:MAG: ABC transporter substrate-binding protein, partial [Planctomycetota bacterium]
MTTASPDAPATDLQTLRLGHSPDPDDAFMWWPLADFIGPDGQTYTPQIDTGGYRFVHVLEDIQSL